MKLFEVKFERDGLRVKALGVSETALLRESVYYAANSIDDVWKVAKVLRSDDSVLISISTVLEQVSILATSE